MSFWKKDSENTIIQCTACEWRPDGAKYWGCSCGHLWNTFSTKGECPKCKKQWKITWCPGCGHTSPHKDWYKTKQEVEQIEKSGNQELRAKKKSLESRLINYGIKNSRVRHLAYLDHSRVELQSTYVAGCRMIICYFIGYAVHNLERRPKIIKWFKAENIWDEVSARERDFLNEPTPKKDLLMKLSWRIESALTLGWCLYKVTDLPNLDVEDNSNSIDEFEKSIPSLGHPLSKFLSNLEYRDMDSIYEENLLNESVTSYFRDLLFSGRKDETQIIRFTSFERHQTLNWLRKFMGISDWDLTDTST